MADQKSDVVVVGGGVIGVCTAYYLQKSGKQVTLLERDQICSGASFGNSGLIVPSHSVPIPGPGVVFQALKWMFDGESPFYVKPRFDLNLLSWLWKFRSNCNHDQIRNSLKTLVNLSRSSRLLYDELLSQEKIECDYQTSGLIMVYNTENGYLDGVHEARLMKGLGLSIEEMESTELIEREPDIKSDVFGGVFYSEDAFLNPLKFVTSLSDVIKKMGVKIQEGVEVSGFDNYSKDHQVVNTNSGDYSCKQLVLATGSWSRSLATKLNMKLPVEPAKGYSVTFDRVDSNLKHALILGEAKIGVNPMNKKIRLAGTLELAGNDLTVNMRRVKAIVKAAKNYLNSGNTFKPDNVWAGLRPVTPDGVPIIGNTAVNPNVVVATGHATIGMTLGPITGKLVSEIINGDKPSIDLEALSPTRF